MSLPYLTLLYEMESPEEIDFLETRVFGADSVNPDDVGAVLLHIEDVPNATRDLPHFNHAGFYLINEYANVGDLSDAVMQLNVKYIASKADSRLCRQIYNDILQIREHIEALDDAKT